MLLKDVDHLARARGRCIDKVIPEYTNIKGLNYGPGGADLRLFPLRSTKLRSFSFESSLGIDWFRRVKTEVGWHIEHITFKYTDPDTSLPLPVALPAVNSTKGGSTGFAVANLTPADLQIRAQWAKASGGVPNLHVGALGVKCVALQQGKRSAPQAVRIGRTGVADLSVAKHGQG